MDVRKRNIVASNEQDNFLSSNWLPVAIKTPVNWLTTEPQIICMIYSFAELLTLSYNQALNISSHCKAFQILKTN